MFTDSNTVYVEYEGTFYHTSEQTDNMFRAALKTLVKYGVASMLHKVEHKLIFSAVVPNTPFVIMEMDGDFPSFVRKLCLAAEAYNNDRIVMADFTQITPTDDQGNTEKKYYFVRRGVLFTSSIPEPDIDEMKAEGNIYTLEIDLALLQAISIIELSPIKFPKLAKFLLSLLEGKEIFQAVVSGGTLGDIHGMPERSFYSLVDYDNDPDDNGEWED